MRWSHGLILALLLGSLSGCGLWAAYSLNPPSRFAVEGLVRTSLGPLSGIQVSLSPLQGETLAEAVTGENGRFVLSVQAPGPYLLRTEGAVELGAIAQVTSGKECWVVLSPGSTLVLSALEAIGFPAVDERWLARVSATLDGHPLLAAGSLELWQSRLQAFPAPMKLALHQVLPPLLMLSPSTSPEALKVALLEQLVGQLPAKSEEWSTLLGIAVQRIDPGTIVRNASPERYLYWESERLSTLEGTVSLGDPGANRQPQVSETVRIHLCSFAEPQGEEVSLIETAPNSGLFRGTVMLERRYDEEGQISMQPANGKLAVCADGDRVEAAVEAAYGESESQARFTEPSSTVTGVLLAEGVPFAGAEVCLAKQGFSRRGRTRTDGTYAFYEVPSGSYLLTARKEDRTITAYKTVP